MSWDTSFYSTKRTRIAWLKNISIKKKNWDFIHLLKEFNKKKNISKHSTKAVHDAKNNIDGITNIETVCRTDMND